MASIPEPLSSDCPGFCPEVSRVEPPRVMRLGPLGAQRIGLVVYHEEKAPVRFTGKPHNSVTNILESAQTSIPHPRPLTPQQGRSSARWINRESRKCSYFFPPSWCCLEGQAQPKRDGTRGVVETTQHRYPGSCFLCSLLRTTYPSFSSHNCSLLCPHSVRVQGK